MPLQDPQGFGLSLEGASGGMGRRARARPQEGERSPSRHRECRQGERRRPPRDENGASPIDRRRHGRQARHPLQLEAGASRGGGSVEDAREEEGHGDRGAGGDEGGVETDVDKLELKRAVPEGTVELLGKGRGADPRVPANREKTILVESLRPARKLRDLLDMAGLAKSSHRHQMAAMAEPDKYADLRIRICEIFREGRGRHGCRRIHSVPRVEGLTASEKVVCRIMAEEDLHALRPRKRRCSSCKGEIPDAPENPVNGDFHADAPNILWVTDITELSVPAGKVHLGPIIDCLDGRAVARTMPTFPNAELVNTMLYDAAATLGGWRGHPVGHNDRGCRHRRPGWIERCERHGITRSMSRKGCSPDDSATEGFLGRLKVELFYGNDWRGLSIERFMGALGDHIDWCNEKRIKVSLGGLSPVRYRRSLGLTA